jgi:DNA-binding NtrC family response regulator/tetratricopeptide (TPR) repeat protein
MFANQNREMFETVIEDPAFFGSHEVFDRRVRHYTELSKLRRLSEETRFDIRRALLRVKRLRRRIGAVEAREELDRIGRHLPGGDMVSLKYRIAQAELELYYMDLYIEAKEKFEMLLEEVTATESDILYILVATSLSIIHMTLGDVNQADALLQDCFSISRRRGFEILQMYSLINLAILRKKMCMYAESEHLLARALKRFKCIGANEGVAIVYNNLGVVKLKIGDWKSAEYCFRTSAEIRHKMQGLSAFGKSYCLPTVNWINLASKKRQFAKVRSLAAGMMEDCNHKSGSLSTALMLSFLGCAELATDNSQRAGKLFEMSWNITREVAPNGDIASEVMRHQAEVFLAQHRVSEAETMTRSCIRLSRCISDAYETGAALRVLGMIHRRRGQFKKATSAFEHGIRVLRRIGECYELMCTCLEYSEMLVANTDTGADVYVMEVAQLCRKLGIDFYMAKSQLLSAKHAYNSSNYMAARRHLKQAEELTATLQECDRKKLEPELRQFYKLLERAILKSSMESAQQLRSIGKLYEDARYPIEELNPEMALEVAKNVGAKSLFLAKRQNRGYRVPIRYNISVTDAKQVLRLKIRGGNPKELFQGNDPKIRPLSTGENLVGVPGRNGYVLCTIVESEKRFTPRELEFLFASVEAMERVAVEYVENPMHTDINDFVDEVPERLVHPGGVFEDIITLDPQMIKLIQLAARASEANVPILLDGETGVGKELFAKAIHAKSGRRYKPFVAINTGGVPLNLLETQLFGHVRGAYTDAVTDRTGLIQEAKGGTVFLDEIGEACEELQVKLLRLLENGEFRRLGENKLWHADVRVVSATNKNLERLVRQGTFREDLFYRLATVCFKIPPLRARKRDIEFLTRHFLREGLEAIGKPRRIVNVDVKALEAFEHYSWPGNVRELRNEILRVLALIGDGEIIRFGMLSDRIKDASRSVSEGGVLTKRVERYERHLILKALEENDWNRVRTAEQIGIPRSTLLFKMKRLNIVA